MYSSIVDCGGHEHENRPRKKGAYHSSCTHDERGSHWPDIDLLHDSQPAAGDRLYALVKQQEIGILSQLQLARVTCKGLGRFLDVDLPTWQFPEPQPFPCLQEHRSSKEAEELVCVDIQNQDAELLAVWPTEGRRHSEHRHIRNLDGFSFDEFTLECPDGVPADLVRGEHGYHLIPSFDDGVPTFGGRRWEVIDQSDTHLAYRSQQGDLELVATYTLDPTSYLMGYQVTVRNTGSERRSLSPKMSVFQPMKPAKNRYSSASTPFASLDGKIKEYQVKSMDKKGLIQVTGKEIAFAGVGERYFMTALVPAERPASFEAGPVGWLGEDGLTLVNNSQLDAEGNEAPRVYRSTMLFNEKSLEPGDSATYDFDLYMGPKVLGELKELGVGLETTVKFGLFAIIARPMLWLLNFMYSLVHSWGIAIILLTVVVKLLVFPLDQASYKSMKKMRVLAPRMQEIRDQFKSDPQRQQQEIMNMYKEAGANPFSGCLPMLIQMPIWFALYRVLWSSIELYQVPFLYFCDLTARDPLCIFPLALSGVMYVQQKMSPPPTDPNQKMMMQMMPFFFAFIMFALPSGLVLYILVSSLLRLGQQWLVNRSGDDEPKAVAAAK